MKQATKRRRGLGEMRRKYGPWAVVTGASSGIGRAIAGELAQAGVDLVLVARRRRRLEELAAALEGDHGVRVRVLDADLSEREQVASVVRATDDLDVGLLVANAGYGTTGELLDGDLDQELDLLEVNAAAVLMLAHAYGRRLRARGAGGIVLLSSIVAFQGVARSANYAASKAYVQSLAEGLQRELRPHGVDVLASVPGPVASGFAERAGMRLGRAQAPRDVAVGTLRALGRRPIVRPGLPSKLLGHGLALAPRALRSRILGRIMDGFTRHQRRDGVPERPAAAGATR